MTDLLVAPGSAESRTRTAWADLGAAGRISGTYRDDRPERGGDLERLRTLLGRLDAGGDIGGVLSACVQLATALPLLAETAPGSVAATATLSGSSVTVLVPTDTPGVWVEPADTDLFTGAVRDAVVLALPGAGGEINLEAVCTGPAPVTDDLLTGLRSRLPAYMVPQDGTVLDQLPLNANGKIDRGAIAALLSERVA